MKFAPIVLFTYNRPIHTQKTLDALAMNPEALESELYIFCDGPKSKTDSDNISQVNKVLEIINKENRFKKVNLRISKKNKGLANSIITGVTEIVENYGQVIVLEDDLETSPGF